MPKMKVKSGAKKRFKVTGSGKIIRRKAYHSHLLRKKTHVQKKNMTKDTVLHKTNENNIKKCLVL